MDRVQNIFSRIQIGAQGHIEQLVCVTRIKGILLDPGQVKPQAPAGTEGLGELLLQHDRRIHRVCIIAGGGVIAELNSGDERVVPIQNMGLEKRRAPVLVSLFRTALAVNFSAMPKRFLWVQLPLNPGP